MEEVFFSVGKDKLSGNLFMSENISIDRVAFLIVHGWQSGQDRDYHLAASLLNKGYTSMTVDLRGHGKSEGDINQLTRKDYVNDVLSAYDELVKQAGTMTEIVAIGSSFGAYLLSLLSEQRKLDGLVLRAPANYQDARFTESFMKTRSADDAEIWKSKFNAWNETRSLKAVHDFKGRVLIVESEKDEVVPQSVLQSYADAILNRDLLTYVIMQDAPHSITKLPQLQKEYRDTIFKWLGH